MNRRKSIQKVALVQMACSEDPEHNLQQALARVREAAAAGATIVCLPELYRTRYFCQAETAPFFELAESIPGPTSNAFGPLAAELGVVLVAPLFERRGPGLYHNSVLVFDAGGNVVGKYRKMHIPDDPGFHEKFYFTPGDLGFKAFDTRAGRVAPLICWDQWYPEAARLVALRGAELIVYPTAIGWLPSEGEPLGAEQLDAWKTVQRSHAIANGCFVASVNRAGYEPAPGNAGEGITFWGHSFICDPFGRVLVEGDNHEALLLAEVDYGLVEQTRREWPFLRDRRIDAYGGLNQRYAEG